MTSALRAFTASFRAATLRSASAGELCSAAAMAEVRALAARARFVRFDLAHRGAYEVSEERVPDRAARELVEIAAAAAGRPVSIARHAYVRLRAGDYSLVADDEALLAASSAAPDAGPPLDLTLDLSDVATGEAEVVFTHRGRAFFTVAQRPGEVGLVERLPSVRRYDRYLTHRVGASVVLRLRLWLA